MKVYAFGPPGYEKPSLSSQLLDRHPKEKNMQDPTKNPTTVYKKEIISIISSNPNTDDPFYVLDLTMVANLYKQWKHHLPEVKPFYAVKCNPEPALLSALAILGAGFDCASRAETDLILSLGVSPDRIIYANTCKAESHIKFSNKVGVNLTTFDSLSELEKLKKHHPNCSLLLRIVPPLKTGVRQSFGSKCGALPEEIEPLLRAARMMDLSVVGVAFHVGTDATAVEVYDAAIKSARAAFDLAVEINCGEKRMHVLDIGGGFTAGGKTFKNACEVIECSIEENFGDWGKLEVMAEPGRYFAEKPFALAVCVIGKRVRGVREYWISDGMYGSLTCMRLESSRVFLMVLNRRDEGVKTYKSTVFGPTLDSTDVLGTEFELPELEVGEWLVLPEMGAYTKCLGSDYNGFLTSTVKVHSFCTSL